MKVRPLPLNTDVPDGIELGAKHDEKKHGINRPPALSGWNSSVARRNPEKGQHNYCK